MAIRRVVIGFLLAGIAAVPSSAQSLKPGLWEIKTQVQSPGGEMERAMAQMHENLAKMPPEQRKMVEENMARQGVSMGSNGSGMNARVCITKEMAEHNRIPVRRQGNCTEKHGPVLNGKMTSTFSCTNPPSSGEAQYTFKGDSAYTMTMHSRSNVDGTPREMTMNSSGRWVSADCGAIKPMPAPGAR